MKIFLILFLACFSVPLFGQGVKITDLPAASAVTTDDLLMIVNDPAGTAANQKITTANFKASIYASPIFTGVVTLPTPFTLGAVSVLPTGTELNFVDGVTSSIQTQLNNRQATNANLTLLQAFGPTQWQSTNANLTLLQAFGPTQWQSTNATLTRFQGIGAGVTGDVLYRDATGWTNLAKAADGTVLKLTSGFPAWGTDNTGGSGDNWVALGTTNSTLPGTAYVDSLVSTNAVTAGSLASVGTGNGALTLWDNAGTHNINLIGPTAITTNVNWIFPAAPNSGLLLGTLTSGTNETISLSSGGTTEMLVGGGANAVPVWTTASGTGAPARVGGPVFTGDPTVPYVVLSDSDQTIANTAFVKSNITAFSVSPALTGNPTAPYVVLTDSDTTIANTAFVISNLASFATSPSFTTFSADAIRNSEQNLGTIAGAGTATLSLNTNIYRAVFSGSTFNVDLPASPIGSAWCQILGTNTSGGVQVGTLKVATVTTTLWREELKSGFTTVTNGVGAAFSLSFLASNGAWSRVSALGDIVASGLGDAFVAGALSQFAATTSAELGGVISDETGSGPLSFSQNGQRVLTISPGGADDTWSGNSFSGLNNSGGVTQWDAVYLNGSSQWVLADANGSGTYPCRGLATTTESTGVATAIIEDGVVRNDAWTWTPGGTIYLSATPGGLTQTAPSTTGDKVQVIGYAIDADTMRVKISADYGTAP